MAGVDEGRLFAGRYRVGPRVGSGGMALVYRAYDTWLNRTVALKVPAGAPPGDPAFDRRFQREARAVASLSHPNVVTVHDCARWAGRPYLTMEFVDGPTLRDLLADGVPMDPAYALELTEQVLQGLAAAHEIGLVHRDVKPANVLICLDGTVKVADFGLARSASASSADSKGVHIGSAHYLAPEQIAVGTVDARADVYAVGIILYEMLTGVRPFQGGSAAQIAHSHAQHDVPPPSLLVPSLSPNLDVLVEWATSRDRDLRPVDAQDLLDQVAHVRSSMDLPEDTFDLNGVGPTGPATGPGGAEGAVPGRAVPARRGGRRLLGAALALTTVAAVSATVGWWQAGAGQVAEVPEAAVGTPQQDSNRTGTAAPTGAATLTRPAMPTESARPRAAITPPVTASPGFATGVAVPPGMAATPDVRRLGTDEARQTLSDAGFAVEVRKSRPYVGGNVVVRQSPAAGRPAEPGSKVVIFIA